MRAPNPHTNSYLAIAAIYLAMLDGVAAAVEGERDTTSLEAELSRAAVDIVTIGQYLRPSRENLPVEEYVAPELFAYYREAGERLGFRHIFSGPFVRSSYRAEEFAGPAGGRR